MVPVAVMRAERQSKQQFEKKCLELQDHFEQASKANASLKDQLEKRTRERDLLAGEVAGLKAKLAELQPPNAPGLGLGLGLYNYGGDMPPLSELGKLPAGRKLS